MGVGDRGGDIRLGSSTASGSPRPRAGWHAIVVEKAQPVPWVEFEPSRSDSKTSCSVPGRLVKLKRSIALSR